MVFECTLPALAQLRQDYNSLFLDEASTSAITTLPALLKQQQNQLASFIGACFKAGNYEQRNQISAQVTAARTTARAAALLAAAAVPRRHSPRFNLQQGFTLYHSTDL